MVVLETPKLAGPLRKKRGFWTIAIALSLVKLGLHFITNTHYELHRDEMLYFNMADHPAFGFASVPPFIGWMAYVVNLVFGYSVFGIRFFPAVFGAFSLLLTAKIVEELKGGVLALIMAGAAFLLSGGFLIFDSLFTPNVFEQFFWLLLLVLFIKMTKTNKSSNWIWIWLVAGFAFLNKYSIVFLYTPLLIFLLFSQYKKILFSKYFWLGMAIGFVICLPNLIWQAMHGWPVFHHMNELKKTQLVNLEYRDYFLDLFSLCSLFTLIWLAGLYSLIFDRAQRGYRWLGYSSIFVLLLIWILHGKAYYVLGLLPFLFACGACFLENYFDGRRMWINVCILIFFVSAALISLPFALPVFGFEKLDEYGKKTSCWATYPFSRWEDGKEHSISQIFADMTGWKEMAGYVQYAYRRLSPEEQLSCTIYAERNYGYAGAIHFYGKDFKLPEPITFLESYTIWAPDSIPSGPMIYLNMDTAGISKLFGDIELIGVVKDKYFREKGLGIWLCRNPKPELCEVYREKALQEKRLYIP
jgi:Dolichyl-phosphate-mannose-protein mannosyltransferase